MENEKYTLEDIFGSEPSFYATPCAMCKKMMLKKDMVTVSTKVKRSPARTICHLCIDCYKELLDSLDLEF